MLSREEEKREEEPNGERIETLKIIYDGYFVIVTIECNGKKEIIIYLLEHLNSYYVWCFQSMYKIMYEWKFNYSIFFPNTISMNTILI